MKLLTFLSLLFVSLSQQVFGSDIERIESEIVMEILAAIKKDGPYKIYSDSQKIKKILPSTLVSFVDSCEKASIAILETSQLTASCRHNIVVTLRYDLLNTYPNSIASFFWQKGRPNIVFIEPRLKKFKLNLDAKFEDFIEQNIW